jgi:hypothetical protein
MFLKPTEDQKKLERDVRNEIDKDELWRHVEHLCSIGEKFSGTPEEERAVDYIVKSVEEHGVPIEVHEFDAFLSHPSHDRSEDAELEVIHPEEFTLRCQSHAMSASTPLIERELVDVGAGEPEDYRGKDVKGKVVLVDFAALWAPERLWIAQQNGAAGQVAISGDPVIHDMVVTTVWGTPTSESSARIPKIPIVSVTHEDGLRLRRLCAKGTVKVRMRVNVWKGWSKVYLPIVTIRGAEEPDEYFLVHGHYCSWGDGMTDNVGGNAQFIEMAKILWRHRDRLRRGVKIAWWPGHSQGRYAGSTWFVDNFWEDLDEHCIGQMNIDSPGVIGATEWRSNSSSELHDFNRRNMEEFSKEFIGSPIDVRGSTWVFRAGDQSFSGIGIPRLGCNTDIPADSPLKGKTTGGGAGGWWWHTLQDTIDKGDRGLLPMSMKVNMTTVLRMCNAPILPFSFEPVADDYIRDLKELQEASKGAFDLSPLMEKAETMRDEARRLEEHLQSLASRKGERLNGDDKKSKEALKRINRSLLKIARILIPTYCTESGRFDQDPAVRIPPLPTLQPVRELAAMDQASDEARFAKTSLTRQRNRIQCALTEAIDLMKATQKEAAI